MLLQAKNELSAALPSHLWVTLKAGGEQQTTEESELQAVRMVIQFAWREGWPK